MPTGEAVDPRDLDVHLFDAAALAEFGHANAGGVAVGGFGQIANDDPLDFGPFVVGGDVIVVFAADDIGVHPAAADVLADLIEQQDVGGLEGEPRNPLLGQNEQLL